MSSNDMSHNAIFYVSWTPVKPKMFQRGGIIANPVSFTIDGHQCVAIATDPVIYVFGL